jgi:hypothetical protein
MAGFGSLRCGFKSRRPDVKVNDKVRLLIPFKFGTIHLPKNTRGIVLGVVRTGLKKKYQMEFEGYPELKITISGDILMRS